MKFSEFTPVEPTPPPSGKRVERFGEVKELLPIVGSLVEDIIAKQRNPSRRFFDLGKKASLTKKEVEDTEFLFRHLGKRTLIALTRRHPELIPEYQEYYKYKQLKEKADKNGRDYFDYIINRAVTLFRGRFLRSIEPETLFLHDISHSVGNIVNGTFKEEGKLHPIFTDTAYDDIQEKRVIEDELYADLFRYDDTSFLKRVLKKSKDFESFSERYIKMSTKLTYNDIRRGLDTAKVNAIKRKAILDDTKAKITEIKQSPPTKLLEILKYIWDHRDNPRVMADLFFKEVGPYIEGLQKRKVYRPQPRLKR